MRFDVKSWIESIDLSMQLCADIEDDRYNPDVVVGVLKGGAVPSRIVADRINVDLSMMKARSYYRFGNSSEVKITRDVDDSIAGDKVLIVDDIVDTGATMAKIVDHVKDKDVSEVRSAVLNIKTNRSITPRYWVEDTDKWVVYPWEYHEFTQEVRETLASDDIGDAERDRYISAMNKVKQELELLKSNHFERYQT